MKMEDIAAALMIQDAEGMTVFLFWTMWCVCVGIIARSRARSGIGWFLLAFLLSPILMTLLVLVLPSKMPLADGEKAR